MQEHLEMVLKLKKSGHQILREWTHVEASMAHMLVGVVDETIELQNALHSYVLEDDSSEAHVYEELGDLIFYLQGLRYDAGLGALPLKVEDEGSHETLEALVTVVKRHLFYGKNLDKEEVDKLTKEHYWYSLAIVRSDTEDDRPVEEILKANQEKLSKRYDKGSFSNQDANERKDK